MIDINLKAATESTLWLVFKWHAYPEFWKIRSDALAFLRALENLCTDVLHVMPAAVLQRFECLMKDENSHYEVRHIVLDVIDVLRGSKHVLVAVSSKFLPLRLGKEA